MAKSYRPDRGTRSFLDIILFRSRDTAEGDRRATLEGGVGRKVSCFLRSTRTDLPKRFRQGFPFLDADDVTWRSGMRGRGAEVDPGDVAMRGVRPVRRFEGVKGNVFAVIEAELAGETLDLAVPKASIDLVVTRLSIASSDDREST